MSESFDQAADQWDLPRLYADLATAKAEVAPHKRPDLTEGEQSRLRGLLLGHSPADIAERQYATPRTVEVGLSQTLYRYVEVLTGRDRNTLDSWRDVVPWLTEAGYRQVQLAINWAQMPEVPVFYGRQVEFDQLRASLLGDSPCRLVAINGPGGIGKTTLAITLARAVRAQFEGVIWQSLRHCPRFEDLLPQWLSQLPGGTPAVTLHGQVDQMMEYLRSHRCLLILDNYEAVLESGSLTGEYPPEYQPYGDFLQRIGEEPHQSCVVVTSREGSREVRWLTGPDRPVRILTLQGLTPAASQQILQAESLVGEKFWRTLIQTYKGNPLMLKIVALTVREVFDGDVGQFLRQRITLIGDIKYLIDQQYDRLSDAEQNVLYRLAEQAEPLNIDQLQAGHPNSFQAVAALLRRSLIEKSAAGFSLRPVVMEYVRQRLV
ncbi:MAG: NB-ARC domain-containing protein [Cyanobacteria bacterium P01_A01_bin.105]